MAVASQGAALSALRSVLNHHTTTAEKLLRRPYLPEGIEGADDSTLTTPDTELGGYGDSARYELPASSEDIRQAVAGPAADVLAGRPMITSDTVEAYVKTSIDLTMQGGTTSGVVYPLAVCELATRFRFRNVGGASAGAIAAALTAAAELGRSEDVRHGPPSEPHPAVGGVPTIRRGFAGLSDLIGWLTQTAPGDAERDEYRLAQLFRPPQATHRIFRVLVAVMRHRFWALPLLALLAFGPITRVVAALVWLGTVLGTGLVAAALSGRDATVPGVLGWGLAGWLAFVVSVTGALLTYQGLGAVIRRRSGPLRPVPDWLVRLRRYTSALTMRPASVLNLVIPGVLLLLAGIAFGAAWPAPYLAAWLVGLAGTLALIGVLVRSALVYVRDFRRRSFGLVAGTTPHRPRDVFDLLAGVPAPTVQPSLVPWLTGCLNQLAGLPSDAVLRFGHLWTGRDYHLTRPERRADRIAAYTSMAGSLDHRLVNLELMTTDLTRQRPYRFPLPPPDPHASQRSDPDQAQRSDPEQLWICLDDLRDGESQLFPDAVMDVLAEGEEMQIADRDGRRLTLHPLPDPWDLPVIFAVRISMALPGLFQAVRLYRVQRATPIQDDLGRTLLSDGSPIGVPVPGTDSENDPSRVAEEVWFSDGGITSNFPVHFFDAALPRWPTVSLNLGGHPENAPHADVWLPQDWDVLTVRTEPLSASGLSLVRAVFNTSMSWRDSMQSAMPGYRNRIAQVRTRSDEGGANLYMSREVIASMALRGVVAGARLRTRFANASQWDRFRWLRLRVAMANMERLRASTGERRGFYADAFTGRDWLDNLEDRFCDKPLGTQLPWYGPVDGFWPKAPRLLNTFVDAYRPDADEPNVMTTDIPTPEPVLRQVPRE